MLQTRKLTARPALVSAPHRALSALEPEVGVLSRARQNELLTSVWRGHPPEERGRWSPRATLAMSGGLSLLLWGAIGLAIFAFR